MVLPEGIEPSTSPLPRGCSTTELRQPARLPGIHEASPLGKAAKQAGNGSQRYWNPWQKPFVTGCPIMRRSPPGIPAASLLRGISLPIIRRYGTTGSRVFAPVQDMSDTDDTRGPSVRG